MREINKGPQRTQGAAEKIKNEKVSATSAVNSIRLEAAGFTLLELLVSITIVSLLAATALFAWRVGSGAWQKASVRLEEDRAFLAAHLLLEEQMASMVPYQGFSREGNRELFFQGEAQTARFVSRYSLRNRAGSGLLLVEYQVADEPGGKKQLLLNERPVTSNRTLGELWTGTSPVTRARVFLPFERGAQTVVLLQGLEECRFEYYRAAVAPEPATWTDQWIPHADELPRAMRIRLAGTGGPDNWQPVSIVAGVRHFARARE